jgi:hypothetical protein
MGRYHRVIISLKHIGQIKLAIPSVFSDGYNKTHHILVQFIRVVVRRSRLVIQTRELFISLNPSFVPVVIVASRHTIVFASLRYVT